MLCVGPWHTETHSQWRWRFHLVAWYSTLLTTPRSNCSQWLGNWHLLARLSPEDESSLGAWLTSVPPLDPSNTTSPSTKKQVETSSGGLTFSLIGQQKPLPWTPLIWSFTLMHLTRDMEHTGQENGLIPYGQPGNLNIQLPGGRRLAIIVVCSTWGSHWERTEINTVVVDILWQGSCKSQDMMQLARLLYSLAAKGNYNVGITHVPGVDNILVDHLSHFSMQAFRTAAPEVEQQLPCPFNTTAKLTQH